MKKTISMIICFWLTFVCVTSAQTNLSDSSTLLEKTLTASLQNEYKAQARYNAIIQEFDQFIPFVQIKEAEQRHIDAIQRLFEDYNLPIPENKAQLTINTPNSLKDAFNQSVRAEINNIEMYEEFIHLDNLPSDVERIMNNNAKASRMNLSALERGAGRYR
ncbi:DUF2202 domain-containing protein [Bacillus sp. 2205SS5-2]|uniref:DUF2202 domain-containing protein n=1 Tax=Bacillus sp. 2205SS5-2 TaxID=3109031 RepID=UPI0030076C7B